MNEKTADFDLSAEAARQYSDLIKRPDDIKHGVESDLVHAFMITHQCGFYEDAIPCGPLDTVIKEMAFKYGRADVVVFHSDGSASVIEAKDGAKGYGHVVAGIGQCSLYASQLAMTRGAVTKVRKCLMWSSTGDLALDVQIELACESAKVIPLQMPHIREIMASQMAAQKAWEVKKANGRS